MYKSYLHTHARKLDLYLYEYLFEGADTEPILSELLNYQNSDGGFGNALEPDLRLPNSSVLATTVAFQYLTQINLDANNSLITDALQYLTSTYDDTRAGWVNIPPSADKYPRAPWWSYESAMSAAEWGNPSAEILGYLLKYAIKSDDGLLQKLTERATNRLNEIDKPEPHEIKCYIRLYDNSSQELQKLLYKPLAMHIKRVTKTNPQDWQGYVPTPLTFVNSPTSPFANLFEENILLENAKFLQGQLLDNNHWEPTWEWGRFENEWANAKQEWSGKITVENLQILKAFGLMKI